MLYLPRAVSNYYFCKHSVLKILEIRNNTQYQKNSELTFNCKIQKMSSFLAIPTCNRKQCRIVGTYHLKIGEQYYLSIIVKNPIF